MGCCGVGRVNRKVWCRLVEWSRAGYGILKGRGWCSGVEWSEVK